MGLRDHLRRAALRPIRQWLRSGTDCELDVRWSGFGGIELCIGMLELNSEAVNAVMLQSSPVILLRATIKSARLAFSLFGAPSVVLVVEGLNLDFSPRNPDDLYWKNAIAERTARQRIERLANIDPEGAAEHSRAQNCENSSAGFFARLVVSFFLSAVRLELHHGKVVLQSLQGHQACLCTRELVFKEGAEGSVFTGSFFGSLGNLVSFRKMSRKSGSASQLSLEFKHNRISQLPSSTSPGFDEATARHAILLVTSYCICSFYQSHFTGLEVFIPEAVAGLNSLEVDALKTILGELDGPSLEGYSLDSSKVVTSAPACRSPKEMWAWAVSKVTSMSPSRRLSQTVKAGILRRRYSTLYSDWLQKVGWQQKSKPIERTQSLAKLSAAVSELEQQLPVEAVALARLIARRRRSAELTEDSSRSTNFEDTHPLRKKWARFLKVIGYRRPTRLLDQTNESVQAKWTGQTFQIDFSQGSLLFSSGSVAVGMRWRKASFVYRSKGNMVENSFVLGSLQGEITDLGAANRGGFLLDTGECKGRWDSKLVNRFVFLSTSPVRDVQGEKKMGEHDTNLQKGHFLLKDRAISNWARGPWKDYNQEEKAQKFLDSIQAPCLVLFYGHNADEQQGVTIMVAVGKVNMHLKYALLTQVLPVVLDLKRFLGVKQSSRNSSVKTDSYGEKYANYLKSIRSLVFSFAPANLLQFSAVIDSFIVALETELPIQDGYVKSIRALLFDLGYMEAALWHKGTDSKWIKQPPIPDLKTSTYPECEKLGSNLVAYGEGTRIAFQRLNNSEENLAGPFNLTLESSTNREQYMSLLDKLRSISIAALLTIPAVNIDLEPNKAIAVAKILFCYINAGMDVISHLYDSDIEGSPESKNDEPSGNEFFLLNLNVNLAKIRISMGDFEARQHARAIIEKESTREAGLFMVESFCLYCNVGDNASASISSGLHNLQLTVMESKELNNTELEQLQKEHFHSTSMFSKFFIDHIVFTFKGQDAIVNDNAAKFYCSIDMDAGVLSVTECPLEGLLDKARLYPAISESMHLLIGIEGQVEKMSFEVQGGVAVFETSSTAKLINFVAGYAESLYGNVELMTSYIAERDNATDDRNSKILNRAYSLPEGKQPPAPIRSQSSPVENISLQGDSNMKSNMSIKVSGVSLLLATACGTHSGDVEGLLLQINAVSTMTAEKSSCKVTTEISQFTVVSLRSNSHQGSVKPYDQVPQFGSIARAETSMEGHSRSAKTADSKLKPNFQLDYILDCLTVSCTLNRQVRRNVDSKWTKSWQGHISVAGFDVAVTTYELQMLMAIIAPLSHVSVSKGSGKTKQLPSALNVERLIRDVIPDGAVVALKDAHEHLYLSVEDNTASKEQFHLGGAWHYSIAGERALFKIKYHDKNKEKPVWFSMLSLYAKDITGVPLRVSYRHGSRQLEISSTNDSSSELWQCIPYRSSADDETNVYNGIFSHLVHIINQKNKQGLALVDGIPTVAGYPGNAFKIEIVGEPSALTEGQENLQNKSAIAAASAIPQVRFDLGSICVTLLHEAAGAVHMLPLVRIRLEEAQGLAQVSSYKCRTIGGCSLVFEHYEAQGSSWLPIINPIMVEIIFSLRMGSSARVYKKFPLSLFCRLKKVEVVVSELSLDVCLFLIGVMDLAGPFTIKHSPVLVNRCQIENQTGLNLVVRFDREAGGQEEGKLGAWQTGSYLMRHVKSRRGTGPAEVSTSMSVHLEKPGTGLSSAITIALSGPGVFAIRTRLETAQSARWNAPGPIVVIDVSKQSQDGIFVTVSPMVKIHNATGLVLQLRCRRSNQGDGGAIVSLKDGDIIDDSMGAFDALNLEGEMKKALISFNVGNFLLSIRPEKFGAEESTYDWSEDVKGAKAVRVSGLFDKLQYSFKKTLKSKSLESSFGSVFCKSNSDGKPGAGLHFLIRTLRRQVPVTRVSGDQQQRRTLIAWQEQQELLLLPMLRMFNFLSSAVQIRINTSADGRGGTDEVILSERGGKACLYADLNELFLVVKVDDYGFVSNQVDVSTGHQQFQELAKQGGSIKDFDIELSFKDNVHVATMKVYRAEDGVLELVVFTKYMLRNDSEVPILCCAAKAPSRWQGRRVQNLQWPPSASTISLHPGSSVSWFSKATHLLMKRQEDGSMPTCLDLDSLSGSSELSLAVRTESSVDKIQLGVRVQVPSGADSNPSHLVILAARYTVVNESQQPICVCQDGLENDEHEYITIDPGTHAAVHAQELEGSDGKTGSESSTLSLRFRLKEEGWQWSGRICAASLGSFFVKLRKLNSSGQAGGQFQKTFALVHVEEEVSVLIIHFRLHSREAMPYRIENRLDTGSITFHQKDTTEPETLLANSSVEYVWDDLSLPHRLVVCVIGIQACSEINLDKVKGWKSFAAAHRSKGFSLQLPFQGQFRENGDEADNLLDVGYEVFADGPTRVLRVCQKKDSTRKSYWESEMSIPQCKAEFKVPTFKIILLETSRQRIEDLTGEELSGSSPFSPFLCIVLASSSLEIFVNSEHVICQLRVQSLGADIKWQGAPFAAMVRIHDQDRLSSTTTALHAACVLSNYVSDPIQVKYSSILLQAFDLNLDEDTLMKLVPFYRTSLSTSSSSLQIYFERFEIHPIKIVASFVPGHPRADYTSTQETFRALLHTVIKLPSVRGATVELNGVLLCHALLTFKQLFMKCVQHYSWYTMRAIYIARGSKLLPPGFSSLFDDSAASSLDVFFDPSSGSVDLQGLTLGMFNLLSRGLRKRGQGGTSRYLGDLENTVKRAGSNLVFAVVTEISDNVLKGAETNGFDGMLNGFRRGILNVAMEPLALQKAVVRGGSTRRIQLDRSVGTDEAYLEGYLQAMLDALFKQDYLKVKVMEDQVILKNLPPNSMLMNEIVASVKNFLISEGLLAGEASIAAIRSMRLLRGEHERKVVPAIISLSEQLLVIFAIRGLRQYTRKLFHLKTASYAGTAGKGSEAATSAPERPPHQLPRPSFKRTLGNFFISSAIAYIDGRLCRHIPNELARRIVSGFLLSFVE